MGMAKRQPKRTARQIWLDGFLGTDNTCCDQPQQTGYDVVMLSCRHNDYANEETNCYYATCDACGNIDTLCPKCVDEAVIDAGL